MKRIMILILILVFTVCCGCVSAKEYDINVDYAELMIKAACKGDVAAGMKYNRLRDLKKKDLNIKDDIQFDCLYLLSKVIHSEAGSSWISEYHRRMVGSVVLNRVASPEFPNTMNEVVYQRGQYAGAINGSLNHIIPSEACVRSAFKLIADGSIAPSSVVFQAEFPQGSGVYKTVNDPYLGTTYFCYSSRPWLYD